VSLRLLDTNIVSYMQKRNHLLRKYRYHLEGHDLAVSFQTLGELLEGGLTADWGNERWADLYAVLADIRVIHSNDDITRRWAEIQNIRKAQPISDADCWIAATAWSCDLELVTHNPSDFVGIPGLVVVTEEA